MLTGIKDAGRIASRINLAIYTDRQPSCRRNFLYEEYIEIFPVQCTLPNNFQLCDAFKNGLCFSGCGTCSPGNAQQKVQPDAYGAGEPNVRCIKNNRILTKEAKIE